MNLVYTFPPYFPKIHSNILSSLPRSSKWFLPGFTTKILYSLLISPKHATCPAHLDWITPIIFGEASSVTFHNKLVFYGEELFAPCPTLKMEDRPFLTVCDCDCSPNIFTATLHMSRPSPPSEDVLHLLNSLFIIIALLI